MPAAPSATTMEKLADGSIDIYAELGVAPDAGEAEITRQYRRQALRFHPDKDSSAGAQEKFLLHQAIHRILTQPALRRQYDEVVAARSRGADAEAGARVAAFREKLLKREYAARPAEAPVSVSALSQKGVQLRRQVQQQLESGGRYEGTRDLAVPEYMADFQHKKVAVFWKQRSEPEAQVGDEILAEIMSVFGAVAEADAGAPAPNNYRSGTVLFQRAVDAEAAVAHDYSRSSPLWRSSRVRKQASLLRRAEFQQNAVDTVVAGCCVPE